MGDKEKTEAKNIVTVAKIQLLDCCSGYGCGDNRFSVEVEASIENKEKWIFVARYSNGNRVNFSAEIQEKLKMALDSAIMWVES